MKSGVSVQEYFAEKMRRLKETPGEGEGKREKMVEKSSQIEENQTVMKRRSRRKRNRTSDKK